MLNRVIDQVKEYIEWEKDFDFSGWQDIEIFTGSTLSEAWMRARPDEMYKFDNSEFRSFVDEANGKWLEKKTPNDKYKVILRMTDSDDPIDLGGVFVHELRHCIDYSNSVSTLSFEEYTPGNRFYCDWSEFRATMVSFRYQFFQSIKGKNDINYFECLTSLLGKWTADVLEGLIVANSIEDKHYYLSRYIGVARAARNLNEIYTKAIALRIWHLMPLSIYENYGCVFYVANDWEKIQICKLNEEETDYYIDMKNRVNNERF